MSDLAHPQSNRWKYVVFVQTTSNFHNLYDLRRERLLQSYTIFCIEFNDFCTENSWFEWEKITRTRTQSWTIFQARGFNSLFCWFFLSIYFFSTFTLFAKIKFSMCNYVNVIKTVWLKVHNEKERINKKKICFVFDDNSTRKQIFFVSGFRSESKE